MSRADLLRAQAEALLGEARRLESAECTGLSAVWCPVHGDCACDSALDDPNCPLRSPRSIHAEHKDDQ